MADKSPHPNYIAKYIISIQEAPDSLNQPIYKEFHSPNNSVAESLARIYLPKVKKDFDRKDSQRKHTVTLDSLFEISQVPLRTRSLSS